MMQIHELKQKLIFLHRKIRKFEEMKVLNILTRVHDKFHITKENLMVCLFGFQRIARYNMGTRMDLLR